MTTSSLSLALAVSYALVIASLGKICGVKSAELQENWRNFSFSRRAVDCAVITFVLLFVACTSLLLSKAREWAASVLVGTETEVPGAVGWAFAALGVFGFLATVVLFFWLCQGRTARMRAYEALKRERKAHEKSVGNRWTPYAKRRDAVLARWHAQNDEAMADAQLQISAFNYGAAGANSEGAPFPDGFMRMPPEIRSDPRLPEKSDIGKYMRDTVPHDDNLFN